jgi:hypothetical protein
MIDEITVKSNDTTVVREQGCVADGKVFMSLSDTFTELIKEAAKNKYFSSDLMIDIFPLYEALEYGSDVSKFIKLCKSNRNDWHHQREYKFSDDVHFFVKYLGFREFGVDHRDFIKHRLTNTNPEYRRILKVGVMLQNNEIVTFLNECDFDTLVELNHNGNF